MTNSSPKIAVLIPCYNEASTIAKVVSDFRSALPEATVYVYDNNSTDHTSMEASKAGAVVCNEYRQGKGNVVRSMFHDIQADCYLMVDGDDTYPAIEARQLCDKVLNEGYDMVIGDRLSSTYFKENKRPFHGVGNLMVRYLINRFFQSNVRDIMTGYRAFSRLFVKNIPILSKSFEIETEMTLHALDKNYRIAEVPITYRDRPIGSLSKLSTFKDGMEVIAMMFRLFRDYKPFLFFSIISVVVLFIAIALFIPVFIDYLHTGLVLRFPTLIVSCFMMLLAMLLFVCGLILEVIANKNKQLYELLLHRQ